MNPAPAASRQAVDARLDGENYGDGGRIVYYNDRVRTRKADVLAVIDESAAILQAEAAERDTARL